MVRVFCDESENATPRIFTVAGWVASPSAWRSFSRRWRLMLQTAGPTPVSSFHMVDLAAGSGEFKTWTRRQRDDLVCAATDALLDQDTLALLYGVSATLVVDDFQRCIPRWQPTADELYVLCYETVFREVIERPHVQNGISFTLDRRTGTEAEVRRRFSVAKAHIETERPGMIDSCDFADDRDEAGIQAADFLCYETRRAAYQQLVAPSRPERTSLRRLRQRPHRFVWYDRRFVTDLRRAHSLTGNALEELWFLTRPPED
jgi:Protein of unknown function (DUF3800)